MWFYQRCPLSRVSKDARSSHGCFAKDLEPCLHYSISVGE
ncbi:hypothetical protein S7335_389 [Synechococcus sp. PCC 7335]|nr:hypothetical protein S7335_389 [Synechococcus sp. PCC 7335]